WITQRPGQRVRTVDFYRWLLAKHIEPYLGDVPIGKLSTQTVREWRSGLLARGVSATKAGKAHRLLRAVPMSALEEGKKPPAHPRPYPGSRKRTSPRAPGPDRRPGLRAGRAGRPPPDRQCSPSRGRRLPP